jgi:hypothetical protein
LGGSIILAIKEIKHVKIASFTLMTASINVILAFITAIFLLIILGLVSAFAPQNPVIGHSIVSLGIGFIFILPISAFFITLAINFFYALLYNILVPILGGIKLGLDGEEVDKIPVIPFTLILSAIGAIMALIIGIFLAAVIVPFLSVLSGSIPGLSQIFANITNNTPTNLPSGAVLGTLEVVIALFLIVGLPILVFIGGFINNALTAIFYNFIATRVSKIKLEFGVISGSLTELKSIPVIPTALSVAVVFLIFGIINGLFSLISNIAQGMVTAGIGAFIGNIIFYFIGYFIFVALTAFFYNWLAPKIGRIKIKLE